MPIAEAHEPHIQTEQSVWIRNAYALLHDAAKMLVDRSFLFDDPGSYAAGVEDAFDELLRALTVAPRLR